MNNKSILIIVTICTLVLLVIGYNVYKMGKRIINYNNSRMETFLYDELLNK